MTLTLGNAPFFTILVPTRDRPDVIGYCLQSLKDQNFPDFEVIVSDNHTARACKGVFDAIADERFRYVTPPSPLAMADNWEFALQHARGQYVGVLIDKTVLLPTALQTAFDAVNPSPIEIVSWWSESYYLKDEASGYGPGTYSPAHRPRQPERFDPYSELERRFSLDVRRGQEGRHYFRGKICFGVYHSDLVNRIRSRAGRLFFPLTPDYTSMMGALGLADSAVDLGRPFVLSFSSAMSTGATVARNPAFARNFHLQADPAAIDNLPLRGLYTSVHNSVAHDYLHIQRKIGGRLDSLQLNRDNLILRAKEDLEQQQWDDAAEESAQEEILASHLKSVRTTALVRHRWTRLVQNFSSIRRSIRLFPNTRRLLRPFAGRNPAFRKFVKMLLREQDQISWGQRDDFSSIIEAAGAANRYYSDQLSDKAGSRP